MKTATLGAFAPLTLVMLAGAAFAQPVLIVTPAAEDIDSTGTRTLGRLVEWSPGPDFAYVPYVWQRGSGVTRIPGSYHTPTMVRGSSDLSALVADLRNDDNWGDLNCFNGYCFGNMTGCTPGEPRPPVSPCPIPSNTHRYDAATGWINAGSFTRLLDGATGRYYGGTRCDYTISAPYDISGNGRYIVGGAYWAPLTTSSGGPGFGLCGNFYAFRYDSATGAFDPLPSPSGSTTTRADHVNYDGSVITGYDLGPIPDPAGGTYPGRRAVVWTNNVETILDGISNGSTIFPVNQPGTVVAGGPGSAYSQATFGSGGLKLVRWVRQPDNSWTPQNLGRPADRDGGLIIDILVAIYPAAISDDGNTIVGTAQYNALGPSGLSRAFIWRPTINNGVPMDLQDYIATLDPSSPLLQPGFLVQWASGISADGNAILATCWDGRNTCTNGGISHMTGTTGVLYLNGAGIACDPARIVSQPFDWDLTEYYSFGAALNVAASGTWPLNYQWQREDPSNPGQWINLDDDCSSFPLPGGDQTGFSPTFNYEGTHTAQLRVGMDEYGVCDRMGRYRVVVSNSCGSVTSDPATLSVTPPPFSRQPDDASMCPSGSATFTVANPVYEPRIRHWQVESPEGSGMFVDVYGPTYYDNDTGMTFDLSGEYTTSLTVSNVNLGSHSNTLRFRDAIDTYACGGFGVSNVATLTVGITCDFNQDGGTDLSDVFDLADAIASGTDPNPGCKDFNQDGSEDTGDVLDLADAVASGTCP